MRSETYEADSDPLPGPCTVHTLVSLPPCGRAREKASEVTARRPEGSSRPPEEGAVKTSLAF